MSTINCFEEIESWALSRELVKQIHLLGQTTQLSKNFSLRDQIQRASVSIMSNIAEGFERGSNKEFIYFLRIARGSNAEVRSQLYILLDLAYINNDTFERLYNLTNSISRSISGFIGYLERYK